MEDALIKRRHAERKAMIDRGHDLPMSRQAALVNISRGASYYRAKPVSDADLALLRRMTNCMMRRIDEPHLELPAVLRPELRGRVQKIDGLPMPALVDDSATRWDQANVHTFHGRYGDYLLQKVSKVFPRLVQQVR